MHLLIRLLSRPLFSRTNRIARFPINRSVRYGWLARLIFEHRCGFVVPPDDPVITADLLAKPMIRLKA